MSYETIEQRGEPFLDMLATKLLRHATLGIEQGQLVIVTPSGQSHLVGHEGARPRAHLHIHDWKLVRRLLSNWDVGFAESYMAGEWSSPDLPALLKLMCLNARMGTSTRALGLLRSLPRIQHLLNRNTRSGSRRNIAAHYDLGNAFYAHWLDESMMYSSALYGDGAKTLEDAQQAKLDRIITLMDLSGQDNVLEIGCGWGGLAERILERSNCNLTGLTLSKEQLNYARKRLNWDAIRGRAQLKLQDYRDVKGRYDRIVSVEMLEAVGERYWPIYFAKLQERLSQSGNAVLQVITIGEEHFDSYRRYPDFIQRYIFPGGMLPTVASIERHANSAGLEMDSTEFFGQSYALTLAQWRKNFQQAWPDISRLGFDERFYYMWDYYLAYCQAGFEAGTVNVGLYKLSRPK